MICSYAAKYVESVQGEVIMSEELTCAFTGHRPSNFHFGYDEEHQDALKLKVTMAMQIAALIDNGVTTFLTGMALGVDMWGAEIVLALKPQKPSLRLIAALPCETQAERWSAEQRERYFNILAACDETVYISRHYTSNCMFLRNRWLVDHANFVLAVYNGQEKGGTAYTLRYAYSQQRAVIVIDPATSEVIPFTILIQAEDNSAKTEK